MPSSSICRSSTLEIKRRLQTLPLWRTAAIQAITWFRRRSGLKRGTGRLLYWLYPEAVRHQYPISTHIRYDGSFQVPVNTKSWIEWLLFLDGYYERHIVDLMRRLIEPGDCVIDIGANIGVHTLMMSKLAGIHGQVIAFEPYAPVRAKLQQTLLTNNVTNVRIVPIALSDHAHTAMLFGANSTGINEGTASLWATEDNSAGATIPADTLTHLLPELNLPSIKLIKIDIQGGELRALFGAQAVLAQYQPFIIFEFDKPLWDVAQASFADAKKFLTDLGYSLYEITSNGSLKSKMQEASDFLELLAVPSGKTLER